MEERSQQLAEWMGKPSAFFLATVSILIWAACGPVFHYSDTWQLVVNTGTTVLTFLMIFLLQKAQNKATLATQLKLNELVKALEPASNQLIDVEEKREAELDELRDSYREEIGDGKDRENSYRDDGTRKSGSGE